MKPQRLALVSLLACLSPMTSVGFAQQALKVEFTASQTTSGFADPIYLRLTIRNLSDEVQKVAPPEFGRQLSISFKARGEGIEDFWMEYLEFLDLPDGQGFQFATRRTLELKAGQSAHFYFRRNFQQMRPKCKFFWDRVADRVELQAKASYCPVPGVEISKGAVPFDIHGYARLRVEPIGELDEAYLDAMSRSKDKDGIGLSWLGYPDNRMSVERLRAMENVFTSEALNDMVEYLIRLEEIKQASPTEISELEKELEKWLKIQPDIQRQILTQGAVFSLRKTSPELTQRLQAELNRERFSPPNEAPAK